MSKVIIFLAMSIVVGCTILGICISESMHNSAAENWRIWGMIVGSLWIWGFIDVIKGSRHE